MTKRPLTIGVDVRSLQTAKTGTRTYLTELCQAFKAMDDEEVTFRIIEPIIPVYKGNNKLLGLTEHLRYHFWKQVSLPIKAAWYKCDIVFCTDDHVPIIHLGYRTVPVIHDAFYFEMPQNYGRIWLWVYLKLLISSAKRSAFVVTPTFYAKNQLARYTSIPAERFRVVYEGPKSISNQAGAGSSNILVKYSLHKSSYILHVGSMFKRKNLPILLTAFEQIRKRGKTLLKLVLAGPIPTNEIDSDHAVILKYIEENRLQDHVILTGYLEDGEVDILYENALMYVFPSTNEGFGIPVLEAFSHDLPVLVANNSCLPEVGGDAVMQFDPHNVNELTDKMEAVISNAELRASMIKKGRMRLQEFSWQKAALQLTELFKEACRK